MEEKTYNELRCGKSWQYAHPILKATLIIEHYIDVIERKVIAIVKQLKVNQAVKGFR